MRNFKSYLELAEASSFESLAHIGEYLYKTLNDFMLECSVMPEEVKKRLELFIPVGTENGEQKLRLKVGCQWADAGFVCEVKNIDLLEQGEYKELMFDTICHDLESLQIHQDLGIRVRRTDPVSTLI